MKVKTFLTSLLIAALVAMVAWQWTANKSLRGKNGELQRKLSDADSETAEKPLDGNVDATELQRLRDAQSELLRSRAQLAELRRELDSARAAATQTSKSSQSNPISASSQELPVRSNEAIVNASVGWNDAVVTGGWRTASGKRALIFVQPVKDDNAGAVTVRTRFAELPDNLLSEMGLDDLKTDDLLNTRANSYSAAQANEVFKMLEKREGVELLTSPSVTTLSGRQAQLQILDVKQNSAGENFTIGPTVDVIPTIAPDGRTVEMTVAAKVSYPKPQPGQ